jgi:cytochrome o ubiquinol oxidase subunit 1
MIVGGVLFGFFAGFTYWFPKITGYKLNEKIGAYAAWCWILGFVVAFMPLYILGLMGATRRLDHYDPKTGWAPLFALAGVGVLIVLLGFCIQVWQIIVSIKQRKQNLDTTGDPWDGRTLEWTTASPPPFYNFARIPVVHERDPFWIMKQSQQKPHPLPLEPIHMPKNTSLGVFIGAFSFALGFALTWHMMWLAALSSLGAFACLIARLFHKHTEFTVSVEEIQRIEARRPS